MRIDEKEDLIDDMCDRYGLSFSYAWGRYYISVSDTFSEILSYISFSREELEGWEVDRVEELVVAYVIVSEIW